jgi:hypothetical protein
MMIILVSLLTNNNREVFFFLCFFCAGVSIVEQMNGFREEYSVLKRFTDGHNNLTTKGTEKLFLILFIIYRQLYEDFRFCTTVVPNPYVIKVRIELFLLGLR